MRGTLFLLPWTALVAGQTVCNVETDGIELETIASGFVNGGNSLGEIVRSRFTSQPNSDFIRLVSAADEGVTGNMWYADTVRLGDGFSASVTFRATGGGQGTDGFAFVVQNFGTSRILGGAGDALGFSNGLDNYLGVGFDACPDREDANIACDSNQIFVEVKQGADAEPVRVTQEVINAQLFNSGNPVNAVINYLADVSQVTVSIIQAGNAVDTLTFDLGQSLEEILGNKFGLVGFTASNIGRRPSNWDALSLDIALLKSFARVDTTAVPAATTEGRLVDYPMFLVDSCDEVLPLESQPFVNESEIIATLTESGGGSDAIVLSATVTRNVDGHFDLAFALPNGVEAVWDMNVTVQGILAQGMPVNAVISTVEGVDEGLSLQSVILIVCLIAVLLIVTVYMVNRLDFFRKLLNRHEEDIMYGKAKEDLDRIDKQINYTMNPMTGTLEQMQAQLEANLKMLEELRSGKQETTDGAHAVKQLVAENKNLKDQIKKLREEEDMLQAQNMQNNWQAGTNLGAKAGGRREFDQERS